MTMPKMTLGKHRKIDEVLETLKKPAIVKRLQVNIDEDLHKRFKITCSHEEVEMTEVITTLITEWLATHEVEVTKKRVSD
ncbi:plasmid partition protein ParG [Yersinia ruckeri]|uniref:plasmid partition protein ParG n=1 Tax=Yersinia ruckeri TaxID=29486 RepID=UPI00207681EE|nr:plasmid partition protein ParG [Yersinia ruckeri]MCW6560019.1 plasmid partition protein ParG [Yersinia ruckeri]MCW6596054.1 plasmid partition protein ParG [Yersinia ruckeri]UZY16893.1 plasmid partition protein ParG [Yersinia ruckeri]